LTEVAGKSLKGGLPECSSHARVGR
jgi:hypothetical protein